MMDTLIPTCSENGRHSVIKGHKRNTNQSAVGIQGQGDLSALRNRKV